MKTHLLLLALGTLTLTACTSEEVIDVSRSQGNVISFDNVVYKSTRAVEGDLTTTTFDNFLVYGYYTKESMITPIQIFDGKEVRKKINKETNTSYWAYEGEHYWVPNCTYYFYAYSCADIALVSEKGKPAMNLTNNTSVEGRALSIMTYFCDGTHQHDLVYAETDGYLAKEDGNPEVALNFKHALCKIKATFTTNFNEAYDIRISDVKISNFDNVADFNTATEQWSEHKKVSNAYIALNIPEGKNVVKSTSTEPVATDEIFIIPKSYASNEFVTIHFIVDIMKDNQVVLQRSITGSWAPTWENAKIYSYNIIINSESTSIEPIVFAASQSLSGSSWDTSTKVEMSFAIDETQKTNE